MTALLLDGKSLSHTLKTQLKTTLTSYNHKPGLAVILIGADTASQVYVKHKLKACEMVGFYSEHHTLPIETSQQDLITLIQKLNAKPTIHGILIQLPLPDHINTECIIETIHPQKDVDGFHPYNIGRLAQRIPKLRPCTPKGIITLLKHYNLPLRGKHAVIVGASNIVGRPMMLELLIEGCTTTLTHRFTQNLEHHVAQADILVVAVGKPHFIPGQWLKSNSIIVDVGINRMPDGTLIGDVDFDSAINKVQAITPVPGGVGPMTIVSLLENTYEAYKSYAQH